MHTWSINQMLIFNQSKFCFSLESCTHSSAHEQIHSYILYAYFTFFSFSPTQFNDTAESSTKMKRSFYAAKDLYKYRHSYPVKISPTLFAVFQATALYSEMDALLMAFCFFECHIFLYTVTCLMYYSRKNGVSRFQ